MIRARQPHTRSRTLVPGSRGFTLMELTLSLAVTSILLVAIGSTVMLAARALPDKTAPADRVIRAGQAMREIAEDLQVARYLTERSATAVTISLPDRNGDGLPERVRYAWSGTPGDPLTRQYNDGPAAAVLDDVHQFNLTYHLKDATEEYPGPLVESAEQILSGYSGAGDLEDYKVDKDHWIGQYLRPSLSADAVRWRVTRVLFRAQKEGSPVEHTLVQLRTAGTDNKPTSTVLEEHTMFESDLDDDYSWREFSFSNVNDLLPGQGLCLVLQHPRIDGPSAEIEYDDDDGTGRLRTSNAGQIWEYKTDRAMRYFVWGTVSTPGPTQTGVRQHVTAVSIALQAGEDPATKVESSVRMLNAPEALSAVWELDFDADPRQVDLGGDGDDWTDFESAIDPATLSDGIWYAPYANFPDRPTLQTLPDQGFTELTTVDVRYRATSVGGGGTVFRINVDRASGKGAAIVAVLFKRDADSQELWIGNRKPGGSYDWFDTPYLGLPNDFVDLRLVIDPAADTVAVFVGGVHKRTYRYVGGYAGYRDEAAAWIYASGCTGEFDYVRVRVGGSDQ